MDDYTITLSIAYAGYFDLPIKDLFVSTNTLNP